MVKHYDKSEVEELPKTHPRRPRKRPIQIVNITARNQREMRRKFRRLYPGRVILSSKIVTKTWRVIHMGRIRPT